MNVGDTEPLFATVYPCDATNKQVIWSSSNENVAHVNAFTGVVVANMAGEATITATTVDGGYTTSCTVTVNYCGGANYRDVTNHTLVLQDDGYYVCSTCGYRIKLPALQDKDVLNESDYLTVVSLLHEHLSILQQYPIYAEKC